LSHSSARWRRSAVARHVLTFVACLLTVAGQPVRASADPIAQRDDQPVLISGAALPEFHGQAVDRLFPFRYEGASASFVPIPFQVDERLLRTFGAGTPIEFSELMYDVLGEDDGAFDADDELVFLFRDAGVQAPAGAQPPTGSDPSRYEIRVFDPRPGAVASDRWVYLFAGDSLPSSSDRYVDWNGQPVGSIETPDFRLDYDGLWRLTGFHVEQCGNSADLIDRVKARAGLAPHQGETEEVWEQTSSFLGGISGPVRAIRYVRGAASGVNTIHHDVVYKSTWHRTVNLRVHPLNAIWKYIDWLPQPGMTLFSPSRRSGVVIDGAVDGPLYTPLEPWNLVRSQNGGAILMQDFPPSSFYSIVEAYVRDDSSYDDAPQFPPGYPDEDDSAWGNHGFRMSSLTGSETDTIPFTWVVRPLCGDQGDADLGDAVRELEDHPLQSQAVPQGGSQGPVRTLSVRLDGSDVVLDWLPVVGASGYRIYRSPDPRAPRGTWSLLAEQPGTGYRDVGAGSQSDLFYSVVAAGLPDELVDLSLDKQVDRPDPAPGEQVAFTLTVQNAAGFATAGRVEVTDPLPDGYEFVSTGRDVGTLSVNRSGQDVELGWQPVTGTASYQVWALATPDEPRNAWTLLADVSGTSYTDAGAVGLPNRFYVVRADSGDYDPATGIWNVGTVSGGASRVLEIGASVLVTGDHVNVAEVTAADHPDTDDTFGDGAGNDHDTASVTPQAP
jgi:uncharacterized repeat protein (TIGR01451 family)